MRVYGGGGTWHGTKVITTPDGVIHTYQATLITVNETEPQAEACAGTLYILRFESLELFYSNSTGYNVTGEWRAILNPNPVYGNDTWIVESYQSAPKCTAPQLVGPSWLGPDGVWIKSPYTLMLESMPDTSNEPTITMDEAYRLMPGLEFTFEWSVPDEFRCVLPSVVGDVEQQTSTVTLYPRDAGIEQPDGSFVKVDTSGGYYNFLDDAINGIIFGGPFNPCLDLLLEYPGGDLMRVVHERATRCVPDMSIIYTSKNADRGDFVYRGVNAPGDVFEMSFQVTARIYDKCMIRPKMVQDKVSSAYCGPQFLDPETMISECAGGAIFIWCQCYTVDSDGTRHPNNSPRHTSAGNGIVAYHPLLDWGFPFFPNPQLDPPVPGGYPAGAISIGYDPCSGTYSLCPYQYFNHIQSTCGMENTTLARTWFKDCKITFAGQVIK